MARNEPKAKEVPQAYQRPAEISNNAILLGRYQLEELLGNFLLEETEREKSTSEVLGFQTCNIKIGKTINTMGPHRPSRNRKFSSVIC